MNLIEEDILNFKLYKTINKNNKLYYEVSVIRKNKTKNIEILKENLEKIILNNFNFIKSHPESLDKNKIFFEEFIVELKDSQDDDRRIEFIKLENLLLKGGKLKNNSYLNFLIDKFELVYLDLLDLLIDKFYYKNKFTINYSKFYQFNYLVLNYNDNRELKYFKIEYNNDIYYSFFKNGYLFWYDDLNKYFEDIESWDICIYIKQSNLEINIKNNRFEYMNYHTNDKKKLRFSWYLNENNYDFNNLNLMKNKIINTENYNFIKSFLKEINYEASEPESLKYVESIGKLFLTFNFNKKMDFDTNKPYYNIFIKNYKLDLRVKFNSKKKVIIIPLFYIFSTLEIDVYYKDKSLLDSKKINNIEIISKFRNYKNVIFEKSNFKLYLINNSKNLKAYFIKQPKNMIEGKEVKCSINNNLEEMKISFFRLKRLWLKTEKHVDFFNDIILFKYPVLTYSIYFFTILINYYYDFLIYLISLIIISLVYKIFNKIYKINILKLFKINKYYIKPKFLTKNQKKDEIYLNFDNIIDLNNTPESVKEKITNIYNNSYEMPILVHKIVNIFEKITNLFLFKDKKKSLLTYLLILFTLITLKIITLKYFIIILSIFNVISDKNYFKNKLEFNKQILLNEFGKFLKYQKEAMIEENKIINPKFYKKFSNFILNKFDIEIEINEFHSLNNVIDIIDKINFSTDDILVNGSFYLNNKTKFLIYYFINSTPSDYYLHLIK